MKKFISTTIEFLIGKEHHDEMYEILKKVRLGPIFMTIDPEMSKGVLCKTPSGKPGLRIQFSSIVRGVAETNMEFFKNLFSNEIYKVSTVYRNPNGVIVNI